VASDTMGCWVGYNHHSRIAVVEYKQGVAVADSTRHASTYVIVDMDAAPSEMGKA
jgi:hypothetical protein